VTQYAIIFISTHVQLGGAETQCGLKVQVLISMCSLGEPTAVK
jgi:hypothetical protein